MRETKKDIEKMDYGGKVSPKRRFKVSHRQEGVRTILNVDHNLDA